MKKEYGNTGQEYSTATEWQQPKEAMQDTRLEYFEYGDELWKEGREFESEDRTYEQTLQETKEAAIVKKSAKKTKLLHKMMYTVTAAVVVVTMARTVELEPVVITPPQRVEQDKEQGDILREDAVQTGDVEIASTVTPTPEPLMAESPTMVLKNIDTSSIVSVNGGVVLVRDEAGNYAAYNYNGEEILLNGTYSRLSEGVSAEGQFALVSEEDAVIHIFDKEGNILLELPEHQMGWTPSGDGGDIYTWLSISENKVLYYIFEEVEDAWCPGNSIYLYDILNGAKTRLAASMAIHCITGIHEGVFFVKDRLFNDGSGCDVVKYATEGTSKWLRYQDVSEGDFSSVFKFSAAPNDGFLRIWGGGYVTYDEEWFPCSVGLMSVDGTKYYAASIDELFQLIYQFAPAEAPEWENWNYSLLNVYEDDIYCGNYQKQVVLELEYKDESVCVLLDFAKAEYAETSSRDLTDVGGTKYYDYEVTNLKDIIVAQYDHIRMSADGYHLASQGDKWFYIDESGAVIAEYKACSEFRNGYALVMEDDGLAYLVDKGFNKLTEGKPATDVYVTDAAFVIVNGEEENYLVLK